MKGDEPFETKAEEALGLGQAYLGVDAGFLTRIETETDHWETVISTDDTGEIVPAGMTKDLGGTYCRHTLERESPLAVHDISNQQEIESGGFECYHGTTLTVNDEVYGTVCFVARDARNQPFSEAETMFAELVGRLLEHELEHERQREQLARQTNLVNVFDRVLRHNIRNKLTVIRANARLHGEQHDGCTECEQIVESADKLISMSETARQLGKSINEEYERRPTDLTTIVENVRRQAADVYPELTLAVDAPETLVVPVYPSLETALWELVENAAEYAGDSPTAWITLRKGDSCVEIEIADDGPGLPEAEQDVLQTGTETQLVHGSGLGLWSVYWVATGHHGNLDIDTADGTRITLTLPRGEPGNGEYDPQIPRAGDRYEAAFDGVPAGLVLLDDDGRILEANGHALALLGREAEEITGRPIHDVIGSLAGPLGDLSMAAGSGTIEPADGTGHLEYTLAPDVMSGVHLLVVKDR